MPNKLQSQVFTTPGSISWTIPAGVTSCWVDVVGAGGGTYPPIPGSAVGGGGSGEYCQRVPLSCNSTDAWVSGGAISGVVGAGGGPASAGGFSSFGPFVCNGGKTNIVPGGRPTGGDGGGIGGVGTGTGTGGLPGTYEYNGFTGGSGGGQGSSTVQGYVSGAAINFFPGEVPVGGILCGGWGANSPFGIGGLNGSEFTNGTNATAIATGGGGGGVSVSMPVGTDGAGGRVQVSWVS